MVAEHVDGVGKVEQQQAGDDGVERLLGAERPRVLLLEGHVAAAGRDSAIASSASDWSTPSTEPSGPTSSATREATWPGPVPRSSTRIPGPIPAARRSSAVAGAIAAACWSRRSTSASSDPST